MKETKIVNVAWEKFDIYIGRPSKWGNPFLIGRDGNRQEVIQKYADWILGQKELIDSLGELDGKTLGCFCKPKECHGDVLIELLGIKEMYIGWDEHKYFINRYDRIDF